MKKVYWIGIISGIFLIGLTAFNFLSDSKYSALNFVPEQYSYFIYSKDIGSLKEKIVNSKTFQEFENNYVFQDIKNRFSKNLDIFFLHSDFNLSYLLSLVKDDLVFGKTSQGFFIAASISIKGKIFEKLFGLLPNENVQEVLGRSYKYFRINKAGKTYYYMMINQYLVIADQQATFDAMVNSAAKKFEPLDKDIRQNIESKDVVLNYKLGNDFNLIHLFPDAQEISLHYQWKKDRFLVGLKTNSQAAPITGGKSGYDFLKLSGYQTPLCYYKSFYGLSDFVNEASQNPRGQEKLKNFADFVEKSAQELTDKIKPGIYVSFDGLEYPSKDLKSQIIPQTSFIFELKDDVKNEEKIELTKKFMKSLEFFFGVENWKLESNDKKNYRWFNSKERDIAFIQYNQYLILSVSENSTKNILAHLNQSEPSVFDRYYSTFSSNPKPTLYSYINPAAFAEKIEPIFKFYTLSGLQMDEDEFDRSFGQILKRMKKWKPYYLSMTYSQEGKKHYGELKEVE